MPQSKRQLRAKILLVDDHPMVRERLADVINAEADMLVCGEAEDRHHALELVDSVQPDLAIIDLTLKKSHGLDLVKDLKLRHPKLLMLVLSMHDESLHAERVLSAGANGYITKQEATKKDSDRHPSHPRWRTVCQRENGGSYHFQTDRPETAQAADGPPHRPRIERARNDRPRTCHPPDCRITQP